MCVCVCVCVANSILATYPKVMALCEPHLALQKSKQEGVMKFTTPKSIGVPLLHTYDNPICSQQKCKYIPRVEGPSLLIL